MKFTQNKSQLTIIVDSDEQMQLRELKLEIGDQFQSDKALRDFLEPLIANSELQWIDPSDTGDLTEAPMLGILGEESEKGEGPYGAVHVGHWDGKDWYQPILQRWAYMDYQVRSPLNDMLAIGWSNFISQ
jgi:hypothetical protein